MSPDSALGLRISRQLSASRIRLCTSDLPQVRDVPSRMHNAEIHHILRPPVGAVTAYWNVVDLGVESRSVGESWGGFRGLGHGSIIARCICTCNASGICTCYTQGHAKPAEDT